MKTIGIFKSACPSGWSRMSGWDTYFLMGASAYDDTERGENGHMHSMTMNTTTTGNGIGSFTVLEYGNHPKGVIVNHTHTITFYPVYTDADSTLPAYRDAVFCYKVT